MEWSLRAAGGGGGDGWMCQWWCWINVAERMCACWWPGRMARSLSDCTAVSPLYLHIAWDIPARLLPVASFNFFCPPYLYTEGASCCLHSAWVKSVTHIPFSMVPFLILLPPIVLRIFIQRSASQVCAYTSPLCAWIRF